MSDRELRLHFVVNANDAFCHNLFYALVQESAGDDDVTGLFLSHHSSQSGSHRHEWEEDTSLAGQQMDVNVCLC